MNYFVRPHPTKNKPIITPVKSWSAAMKLLQQHPKGELKKDIGSGEDVKCT